MANTYEQELRDFRQQWNLPAYDLKRLAENVQALRFADSFLMGSSGDNSPAGQYVKWFARTLSVYFATNTTPNENGKYMSSFDAQEFYDSFKALVQAKYNSDAEEREEVPLQVSEVVTDDLKRPIQQTIANCKRAYKKTLPTLWQENLKQGVIDMQNLRNITSRSYDAMDKKWFADENGMAGDLNNVVAAYEAMKQLRASRSGVWGWFWKVIFNRSQNRQEKEYLQELETQITQLRNKGYNVDKVSENLTGKTVFGIDVNAKTETTKTQTREVEQPQASATTSSNASPVESNAKSATMKPVANQIEEQFDDISSEMYVELYRKISGDQPSVNESQQEIEAREQRELNRSYAYKFLLKGMKDTATELNQQFDEAVANGGNPKKEIQKVVNGIFKATVEKFSMNIGDSKLEKAEAFKNATQIIVNNFTAVAIYPNELGDVVNTYIDKNVEVYKEIEGAGKEYSQEIENYTEQLEQDVISAGDERKQLFDKENPFPENNIDQSAPVNQEPQISAPKLDIK